MPTAYGSSDPRGPRPADDSVAVALMRRAGMVILGKCTTTEFASPVPTGVRNPHDLSRTPGRVLERLRGGRRRLHGAARGRLADRRIDDPAGRLLRHRRLQADADRHRSRQRPSPAPDARHHRAAGPEHSGYRGPACRPVRRRGRGAPDRHSPVAHRCLPHQRLAGGPARNRRGARKRRSLARGCGRDLERDAVAAGVRSASRRPSA